jgi:hypothetical protein
MGNDMPAKTLMSAAEFANTGPETDGFEPAIYSAENEFDGGDVLRHLHFKVAELFE